MSNKMNLPWYSLPYTRDYATVYTTVYTTKKEALIATMQAEYAAHIVKCVNAHDELVEALQAMMTHMGMDEDEWNKPTFDQARAALAKAQGDQDGTR